MVDEWPQVFQESYISGGLEAIKSVAKHEHDLHVYFAAYAPTEVQPNSEFELSIRAFVAAFMPKGAARTTLEHDHVSIEQHQASDRAPRHAAIKIGQSVRIIMQLPDCFEIAGSASEANFEFEWRGKSHERSVRVAVKRNAEHRRYMCAALIQVGGVSVANLQFQLVVGTRFHLSAQAKRDAKKVSLKPVPVPCRLCTQKKVLVMSCPEQGTDSADDTAGPYKIRVMDRVAEVQRSTATQYTEVKICCERAGSSTADASDLALLQSGEPGGIQQTQWFWEFQTRAKTHALVESMGLDGILEVCCINGGAVSQAEQAAMPSIIDQTRRDAPQGRMRCAVDVRSMSFHEFIQRYSPTEETSPSAYSL